MSDRLERAFERVERLPAWLRPPAYGAGFIWLLIGAKGGLVLGPVLLLAILVTSDRPLADLGTVLGALALATAGGAAAGLAYSLVGRRLRRAPLLGPYAAGVLSVAPYAAAVMLIVRLREGAPLLGPPDGASRFAAGALTLLFGPLIGHIFFRGEPEAGEDAPAA